MKISIISALNSKVTSHITDLVAEYSKQMKWSIEFIDCLTNDKSLSKQADLIKAKIKKNCYIITLDINGEMLSSDQLAAEINQILVHGNSHIAFIIGGSDGLCKSIKAISHKTISFGRITMPHQIVRLVLVEQLYRSHMILSGKTYHK